jgi:hypothetical protein
MLASYLAQSQEGHLDQCLHIFAYLKKHKRSTMVFDDNPPHIDEQRFIPAMWTEFYCEAKEVIPPNPEGKLSISMILLMLIMQAIK